MKRYADEVNEPAVYSISAVARMLQVPIGTLRTWEDRYKLVVPVRSPGGRRLYSQRQIDQLLFVKSQIDSGASAADAHRLLGLNLDGQISPDSDPDSTDSSRKLILLAESDPYAAEFEEYFLRDEGYRVQVAPEVEAARKAVEEELPSLVVVELLVSGGLGFELCRSIKRRDRPPPVLAVSVLDTHDRALAAGADEFLNKPLDASRFVETVNRLLAASRSQSAASPAAS